MLGFNFADAHCDLAGFLQWAPHSAKNHRFLAVIFKMATFITVHIEYLGH
jgi:hypothetical protein